LLALRSSPPVFTEAQAERIARDTYGLAVSARALPGERDRNFHLSTADRRHYVLKIVDVDSNPEALDCQLRVLQHLAEQDPALPVPRVLPTALGGDLGTIVGSEGSYATCLLEYLPGRLLADSMRAEPLPEELRAPFLEGVGDVLARLDHALQGFFHPALAQRLAWDVRRLPELIEHAGYIAWGALRRKVESAAAMLEERLPALRALRSQAIHGDCHAHNLLVHPDSRAIVGILDFGDMIHAPRVLEPAVAMSELLSLDLAPLEALSSVIQGYTQRQPLERGELDALYDLIGARSATTILVHAWRDKHDPDGAHALAESAVHAARSLDALAQAGREALTQGWRAAAERGAATARATAPVPAVPVPAAPVELSRRHRLMGAGAELFYEQPLHLVRGSGVWLYDAQGRAHLDVYNNVAHVGHAHPDVVRAIQTQTALLATHTRYLHARILDYAERLTATLPAHLDTCIFVNSGSEANDVAWRIAQSTTGQKGGLVMEHAYHGITEATAALTPRRGEPRDAQIVTLSAPGPALEAYEAPADDPAVAAALAAAAEDAEHALHTLADRGFGPAAFFIDTAITSSGIFDPPTAWASAVSSRLRAAGALIVADEVQYGLGRSGSHLWGFTRRGLEPDIVTLGKPVANGYPMGVVVANRALIEAFQQKYGFFSTFGGNAVAASAALAVLDVLEREQLMSNAAATGAHLRRRLAGLNTSYPCLGAVRGRGLLLGLEVKASGGQTARQCAKHIINRLASKSRVLIGYEGPHASVLKLRPPLPFGPEHADRLVQAIEEAAGTL
jgi:4-aminobutyrate aminotransferase-like enzyme/Ser/Thr protein kinase RdoA (MazF antagonist)